MPFNFPIFLTWARIVLIPLIVGIFYLPEDLLSRQMQNLVATAMFAAAALTDWFDGYLARRWNQTSQFGAFLDPVADKLMVAAALLMLLKLQRVHELIALIIIGREITISALREWMAQIGASKAVAVNMIGKVKTAAQMVAIPMLLYYDPLVIAGESIDTGRVGDALAWLAAVLTVISMLYYLRRAWPQIAERTQSHK
ncbi:CDP-diacylglycerol--glycerol-3-phosphate 3-phosphatidyltransferase [Derxia gummosa]|uniref:CDP-diacylglycerol--glycerol-3-phosphate 3-phosphatidyltransferase n=1 Tax=Derxia gummosa DSM 723 TaxID=1121388 RepID=A0A8B6X6X8_9BURK|nr:CDP-diacylglycerol--glycerol-3-phosphate 3-phosphatidyltransferase [Derxia gummosa]